MLKKFVFLDRDGVINRDSSAYIKSWEEFNFLPGSLDGIRQLTEDGFTIIVITNQSAINRGMIPRQRLSDMHTNMKEAIHSAGGLITDIFFCPHTPQENCNCRKPKPDLILKAQKAYDINLSNAVMVGDSAKDIQCARNAGCGKTVLVQTGNFTEAQKTLAQQNISPDHIAEDLLAAAAWIISS